MDAVLTSLTNVDLSRKKRELREIFQRFKADMINKRKVIIIKQAQVGVVVNSSNAELLRIDKLSKFWVRPVTGEEVDMTRINTNIRTVLIAEYQNDQQFKEEFEKFGKYYETALKAKIKDLSSVMSNLVSDAFEDPETQAPTFANIISEKIQ